MAIVISTHSGNLIDACGDNLWGPKFTLFHNNATRSYCLEWHPQIKELRDTRVKVISFIDNSLPNVCCHEYVLAWLPVLKHVLLFYRWGTVHIHHGWGFIIVWHVTDSCLHGKWYHYVQIFCIAFTNFHTVDTFFWLTHSIYWFCAKLSFLTTQIPFGRSVLPI